MRPELLYLATQLVELALVLANLLLKSVDLNASLLVVVLESLLVQPQIIQLGRARLELLH